MFKLYEIKDLKDDDEILGVIRDLSDGKTVREINKDLKDTNTGYGYNTAKIRDLKKSFLDIDSAGQECDDIVAEYSDKHYSQDDKFIVVDLASDGEGDGLLFFDHWRNLDYEDCTWATATDDYYGAPNDSEDPINDGVGTCYTVIAVEMGD